MTTYTPDEYRAQAKQMMFIGRQVPETSAIEGEVFFLYGAGAAMLEVAAAQLANLQTSLELTENAYNASLDLQSTLLDRCERLQALVDSQRKIIDTQASFAQTQPNEIPERVRIKE